jgi:hypothetical protein
LSSPHFQGFLFFFLGSFQITSAIGTNSSLPETFCPQQGQQKPKLIISFTIPPPYLFSPHNPNEVWVCIKIPKGILIAFSGQETKRLRS